jgi:hypothetical protein
MNQVADVPRWLLNYLNIRRDAHLGGTSAVNGHLGGLDLNRRGAY